MLFNRLLGCLLVGMLMATNALADEPAPSLTLQVVDKGFDNPLYFINDPTGRNFVVEQAGRVVLLKDGHKSGAPYLDITDRVKAGGECGLLSVAFHPKFAENGRVFVDYTASKPNLHTVISEFKADPKAGTIDATTEKILLKIDQPQGNHNGGLVIFGPDGMLYIGMGDGGAANDTAPGHVEPGGNGQSPQALLGKILRLDVDSPSPYIPKDNPFVDNKEYRPEIWSLGMRNPWRFSFDRETKLLYCGDVGQGTWEEVDIITKGGNYGWRIREGLHPFRGKETSPDKLIDPIAEYSHKEGGLSITGGYVYRGKKYPELKGVYIYGDYSQGRFYGLRYEKDKVTWKTEFNVSIGKNDARNRISISSFGEDADGELYVCDLQRGIVYQIEVAK